MMLNIAQNIPTGKSKKRLSWFGKRQDSTTESESSSAPENDDETKRKVRWLWRSAVRKSKAQRNPANKRDDDAPVATSLEKLKSGWNSTADGYCWVCHAYLTVSVRRVFGSDPFCKQLVFLKTSADCLSLMQLAACCLGQVLLQIHWPCWCCRTSCPANRLVEREQGQLLCLVPFWGRAGPTLRM